MSAVSITRLPATDTGLAGFVMSSSVAFERNSARGSAIASEPAFALYVPAEEETTVWPPPVTKLPSFLAGARGKTLTLLPCARAIPPPSGPRGTAIGIAAQG